MPQFSEIAIATNPTRSDRAVPTTCADCPYFAPDQGVYGWCRAFDKPARPNHEKTKACDQEIEVLEHNHHIPEPATTLAQSQGAEHVPPTQLYKKGCQPTRKSCYVVAQVLSWEAQRDIIWDEIETIAITNDVLRVNLTYNRTVHIAIETFRAIRRQQLEEQARIDADLDVAEVLRQLAPANSDHLPSSSEHLGFNSEHYSPDPEHSAPQRSEHYGVSSEHLNPSSLDYDPNSPDNDIEVDSDNSVNPTYRVWRSWHLLGTFHRSPADGRWLTNPVYGRDFERYTTPEQAVAAIAVAWNHAQELRNSDQAVGL